MTRNSPHYDLMSEWLRDVRRRRTEAVGIDLGTRGSTASNVSSWSPPGGLPGPGGPAPPPPPAPPPSGSWSAAPIPPVGHNPIPPTHVNPHPGLIQMVQPPPPFAQATQSKMQQLYQLLVSDRAAFWDASQSTVPGFDLADFSVISGAWGLLGSNLECSLAAATSPQAQIVWNRAPLYNDAAVSFTASLGASNYALLRWNGAAQSGYAVRRIEANGFRLFRFDASVPTVLSNVNTWGAWGAGDVMTLAAIGTQIQVIKNNGAFFSALADATYASGAAGLGTDTAGALFTSFAIVDRPTS